MRDRGFTRRTVLALGTAALGWRLAGQPVASTRAAFPLGAPESLTGRVIWPDDAGYESARWDFNTRISRFPAGIVICRNAEDVQHAVRWARQEGMPFVARSGGHSYEAYSILDRGLVIDVGGLQAVDVDLGRGEATIGTGVRLMDLYRQLAAYGVTIPAGTCPGVGIAGLTLGGGVGFLSRQYGLTCDNLVAAELVDASGDLLIASEVEHADLFWALRGGGGGNFGIVTAFTFRIHPIDTVTLCTVNWRWGDVAEVFDAWQRWAPHIDHRLTAGLGISHPGHGGISSTGLFTGSEGELWALLDPLLRAGSPDPPYLRTMPFLAAAEELAGSGGTHARFKNASAVFDTPLSPSAIDTLVSHMQASPAMTTVVGCFPFGGAIEAIEPTATAFAHRSAHFDLQYQAYWGSTAEDAAGVAWVNGIRDALLPHSSGAYINYIDAEQPDWASAYYGANLPSLQQVKARYDPSDCFNGPGTIPG
jgi:FAD/FMN-containing dehydrogenase